MQDSSIEEIISADEPESMIYANLTVYAEETAKDVIERLKSLSVKLVLAESCTAGLISGLLANISGASEVLWGSFVCYTQEAKAQMLGCDNDALNKHGLVSFETACAMAEGALKKSGTISAGADIAAAVTGLAGPGGDGVNPVGTVWIAAAQQGKKTEAKKYNFAGSRNIVRMSAAAAVMKEILKVLSAY
ncbi:MAG: nicotinamide-nucleotide amidohydrolase family protein [Treponema sp.]|nr:nicotinamide-nucleotide amidohydrolase family protein [Treponema sp.]